MSLDRQHLGNRSPRILGPRALAVISCALALLAAQPVMAAERAAGPTVKIVAATGGILSDSVVAIRDERRSPAQRRVGPEAFLSSARRLHVLATLEILHRLLAFELRPVEKQVMGVVGFSPLVLCLFEAPAGMVQCAERSRGGVTSCERAFAMAHCLLAPPAV